MTTTSAEVIWTATTKSVLPPARFGHTAVSLDAGGSWGSELVIMFGGVGADSRASSEVWVYHVDSQSWSCAKTRGQAAPNPRAFHCCTATGSKMYVFGGFVYRVDGANKRRVQFNDMWLLNADSMEWSLVCGETSETGTNAQLLPPKRDGAVMNYLGNNKILLFGGKLANGTMANDLWLFDTVRSQWQIIKAKNPPPARALPIMLVLNDRILMHSGNTGSSALDDMWVLRYNLENTKFEWAQIHNRGMPPGRYGHSGCVANMCAIFFGGRREESFMLIQKRAVMPNDLLLLDLSKFQWITISSDGSQQWPSPRLFATLTLLKGGELMLLGGRSQNNEPLQELWWLNVSLVQVPQAQSTTAAITPISGSASSLVNPANFFNTTLLSRPPLTPKTSNANAVSLLTGDFFGDSGDEDMTALTAAVEASELEDLRKQLGLVSTSTNPDSSELVRSGRGQSQSLKTDRLESVGAQLLSQVSDKDSCIQTARYYLYQATLEELKMADIEAMLQDYKLLSRSSLKGVMLEGVEACTNGLLGRYMHVEPYTLKLRDIHALQEEYRQLVDASGVLVSES